MRYIIDEANIQQNLTAASELYKRYPVADRLRYMLKNWWANEDMVAQWFFKPNENLERRRSMYVRSPAEMLEDGEGDRVLRKVEFWMDV